MGMTVTGEPCNLEVPKYLSERFWIDTDESITGMSGVKPNRLFVNNTGEMTHDLWDYPGAEPRCD